MSRDASQDTLDQQLIALMIAARDSDRVAYRALLRACEPIIRRVARRTGVTDDRIHDVVQETLVTVHHARQTYDPSRSFVAWLTVIAQRRAVDALRRHGRNARREVSAPLAYETYADVGTDAATRFERAQRAEVLHEAVALLPRGQREAVERLALREQSLAEAAAETGKSAGSLKINLHRAIKALRAHLGGGNAHEG